MKDTFTNFVYIIDFIYYIINTDFSSVMNLTSWCWIESTTIQKQNIFTFLFVNCILSYSNSFCFKIIEFLISIIEILGFRNVYGIIKHHLLSFSNFLFPISDLIIEISRNLRFRNLCDKISRDSPCLECHYPII